jgi:hypothetical protein
MIHALEITLSTTAQKIVDCTNVSAVDRCQVLLQAASGAIQVGGPDVSVAGGLTIAATTGTLDISLGPGDDLWAVAAGTGTTTSTDPSLPLVGVGGVWS